MKGNVLDQCDPLVPVIDVDQGGLGEIMLPDRPGCEQTRSYAALASPLMLTGQSVSRPSGMATAPRQSAPSAAAVPLKGRPYGAVLGQVSVDSRTNHE